MVENSGNMRPIDKQQNRNISRRQWMAMLGIGGAATVAGCLGDDADDAADDADDTVPGDDGDDEPADDGDDDAFAAGDDDDDDEPLDELPDVMGTYHSVQASGFDTLNELFNTEAGAGSAIALAFDQPYTFDENNEFFGLLYEDMTTDDGGTTWTIKIRENLEWSDPYGSVTAEDFVYTIQELHQADWAPTADSVAWDGVEVEQTGEYEFQTTLPTASLLYPESFDPMVRPMPRDLIEPYVEDEDVDGLEQDEELLELQYTGNMGAYTLDEWQRDAGTVYTRNDDYYLTEIDEGPELFEAAPYFEDAEVEIIEEEAARLGALQAGETLSVEIPPERVQEFEEDPDVTVRQIPTPYNTVLSVNMRDNGWTAGPGNLFIYKEFRQAVNCAINKEDLIEGVFRGLAEPHYTWQPRFSEFYPGDDDIPLFGTGDLYGREPAEERALEAFERSDYDYSFDGDTMVTPDGDPVELDIYINSASETQELQAEFMSQELQANLGIELNVNQIDGTQFSTNYWSADVPEEPVEDEELGRSWAAGPSNPGPRSVTSDNDWDMATIFGLNTYPRNPLTASVFFDGPDTTYNPVGWYPEHDAEELWEQAQSAEDRDELQAVLDEIFIELAYEQPYIMLAFSDDNIGYDPDLVGPIESFNNGWDSAGWYLDRDE